MRRSAQRSSRHGGQVGSEVGTEVNVCETMLRDASRGAAAQVVRFRFAC